MREVRIGARCWNQYTDWPNLLQDGARADWLGHDTGLTWGRGYSTDGARRARRRERVQDACMASVTPSDQPVCSAQSSTGPTYRAESTMSNEPVASETRGVEVKLLASVDLASEIEGMAGRQLRMRMVTIEPGGVFGPIHDHRGRPGMVYVLQGTITDHRDGVTTDYGPGVGWPEDRNTTHWLENRGTIPAVEISVDIVRGE
jgi:quercetin dioxygenase-like cupin family protein